MANRTSTSNYSANPVEAVTLFLARYLEAMLYEPSMLTLTEIRGFLDHPAPR